MPKKTQALTLTPNKQLTALKSKATRLCSDWKAVSVRSTTDFEAASIGVKDFVSLRKDLKSLLDPEIKEAKALYDAKRKRFKEVDDILRRGEDSLRLNLADYAASQRQAKEAKVEKALSLGKDEKAASLAAVPFVPDTNGVHFTEHWHAEVTDMQALVKAVASGKITPECLLANVVYLNAQARALKASLDIPGVTAVKETSTTVRG